MDDKKLIRFGNSQLFFHCPICKEKLYLKKASLTCRNNHCFDISKYGYVNFLLNGKQQKNYSRTSFENRRLILEQGAYDHILQEISDFLKENESVKTVLDAGCGEGFYSNRLYEQTHKEFCAFDISKDSIQLAARSDSRSAVKWFAADLTHIPLQNHSAHCILNIYSPANYKEFRRILAPDGYIVKVVPGTGHLKELREAAQPYLKSKAYSNESVIAYFERYFSCLARKKISRQIQLSKEQRDAFVEMTPLLFHVDKKAINWDENTNLTIEAELLIGRHPVQK